MCIEDLKLGRGRYVGRIVQVTDTLGPTVVLPPNNLRVAILFAPTDVGGPGAVQFFVDFGMTIRVLTLGVLTQLPYLMRIEDVGQLVTGPFWCGGVGDGTIVSVTEILTNVKADPLVV